MTIELSPELQLLVEEQVKAGHFASPSEAVNIALDHMLFEDYQKKRENLLAAIDEGLADADAGRCVDDFNLNNFLVQMRREYNARHST